VDEFDIPENAFRNFKTVSRALAAYLGIGTRSQD
jgi:hypothetical protein